MSSSPSHKQRIVIAGYYGFGNTGDEAILDAMLGELRHLLPACDFIVVSERPEKTASMHGVEALHRVDYQGISRAIDHSDLVIVGGGGLFQDIHGISAANIFLRPGFGITSYAEVPLLAAMHRKPLMFYAQGVGPLFPKEAKTFVSFTAGLADIITTRDEMSKNLLQEIGVVADKIIVSVDPALNIAAADPATARAVFAQQNIPPGANVLVASIRQWVEHARERQYVDTIARALDDFLSRHDFHVLFLPFQLYDIHSNDATIIAAVIEKMQQRSRCHALQQILHPREMAGLVGAAQLVLGMRLHSVIFAARAHVPVVALTYDPKVRNFMQELGQPEYCFDLFSDNATTLSALLENAWRERTQTSEKLAAAVNRLRRRNYSAMIAKALLEHQPIPGLTAEGTQSVMKKIQHTRILETLHRQTELLSTFPQHYERLWTERQKHIRELEAQAQELKRIKNSHTLQLANWLFQMKRMLSPQWWRGGQLGSSAVPHRTSTPTTEELPRNNATRRRPHRIPLFRRWYRIARAIIRPGFRLIRKMTKTASSLGQYLTQRKGVQRQLDLILRATPQRSGIMVYLPCLDWDVTLFQRPQQLALAFARRQYLFFYCTPNRSDEVSGIKSLNPYLHLISSPYFLKPLTQFTLIADHPLNYRFLKSLNPQNIIYDIIDEMEAREGYGQRYLRQQKKFLASANLVTVTADKLVHQTTGAKGKVVLTPNAVDLRHFAELDQYPCPPELTTLLKTGKPIIGYYGAFERWVDFDLITYLARRHPNLNFLYIGPDPFGYAVKHRLQTFQNIHFLGPRPYAVLPGYLKYFDVATIPFKVDRITRSTSPIKLFEYLAARKPVVTTDLDECRKYRGVLVAASDEEFSHHLIRALQLKHDATYLEMLHQEAAANTWDARVDTILQALETTRAGSLQRVGIMASLRLPDRP